MSAQWDPSGAEDHELRRYLQVVWRRKLILLLCLTLVPLTAYLVSSQADERYSATATLQIEPTGVEPLADVGATTRALAGTVRIAGTIEVARAAAEELGVPPTGIRDLRDSVEFGTDSEAGFVTVTGEAGGAQRAADVANAFAAAVERLRTERAQQLIDVSIRETLNASGPDARDDAGVEQLRVARAEQKNKTQVIEPAVRPDGAESPKPVRSAILAFVVALMIGLGLVFVLDALDRQLREPDEIEGLLRSRLLGSVPASAPRALGPESHESYQMLRATLTYFNVGPLDSVLVTSPASGDGKTTVATNLAVAFARSGKRVTLIDADLRRPQVDALVFDERKPEGLGSVIAGEIELDDALRTLDVGGGELRVLPAGFPPPNPSELLGSEQMFALLAELGESSDLVILDTPPVLVVSDAIPLINRVSGIVVVSRVGHTPRKAIARLARLLTGIRAKVLGAVVTGVDDEPGYGYSYEQPAKGRSPAPDKARDFAS